MLMVSQIILASLRLLYRIISKESYNVLYNWVDEKGLLVRMEEHSNDYPRTAAYFLMTCTSLLQVSPLGGPL
jgi:hypothetical protein